MEDQEETLEIIVEQQISLRIQELRRSANLTIDQLADRAGYKSATLQAALGGRARWRVGHLVRLSAALGVAPDALLPSVDPPPPPHPGLTAAVLALDAPAALRELAAALERASPGPAVDQHELAMVHAMRARDASAMMALTAQLMRTWGTD